MSGSGAGASALRVKHRLRIAATDSRRESSSTYTVNSVSPAATGSPSFLCVSTPACADTASPGTVLPAPERCTAQPTWSQSTTERKPADEDFTWYWYAG